MGVQIVGHYIDDRASNRGVGRPLRPAVSKSTAPLRSAARWTPAP
jgi:hypothetical protein